MLKGGMESAQALLRVFRVDRAPQAKGTLSTRFRELRLKCVRQFPMHRAVLDGAMPPKTFLGKHVTTEPFLQSRLDGLNRVLDGKTYATVLCYTYLV
jgi:hypothetical protein